MPRFSRTTYADLITEQSETQRRLLAQYGGDDRHFEVIVVGSGMGGGLLADDLADKLDPGKATRILVLEAGSYLFPTHVYNLCRFPNADVARRYAVTTFTQRGGQGDELYIHERPQLNFGGRSVFWSGLIPRIQPWELEFFPQNVRDGISSRLDAAAEKLNASVTLGHTAQAIVAALRQSQLADDFDVRETPRALHQPYLTAAGTPTDEYWTESTGVFNTAELLTNQIGLNSGDLAAANRQRPQLLLNHYVESVERRPEGGYRVRATDTIADRATEFTADVVVLAAGSIESPKIVRRSPVFDALPAASQALVGRGLTDHPTTDWLTARVSHVGGVAIPRKSSAKIIFYSKGRRDGGSIVYPFNVEMNVNHEFWHLREDDPSSPAVAVGAEPSIVDVKFSFGNPLDDGNAIDFGAGATHPYVPEIRFKNLNWVDDLARRRFGALAGWNKSVDDVWVVLNDVANRIFSQFRNDGDAVRPDGWLGQGGKGFGLGTVHHAAGTLRMPYKDRFDALQFSADSVVDENLMLVGHPNLYVCDMSVMPHSSCANPVRTLTALALRLSERLRTLV